MYKTKIDWCESTWNPVTGCLHGCPYCYARSIAQRFSGHCYGDIGLDATTYNDDPTLHYLQKPTMRITKNGIWAKAPYPFGFEPTFHSYRLEQPTKWSEPRTIFVCSMADLFGAWVPKEWWKAALNASYAAPQHRYLFLTKNPERYGEVVEYLETYVKDCSPEPPQIWLGASVTNNQQLDRAYSTAATWLSIEPLRERLLTDENFVNFRAYDEAEYGRWGWVVIGAETGNHTDKVIPEREWVMEIVEECAYWKTPIFMKESLRNLMGNDFRQEFPWGHGGIT